MDLIVRFHSQAAIKSNFREGWQMEQETEILGGEGSGRKGRRRHREGRNRGAALLLAKIMLRFAKIATRHSGTYLASPVGPTCGTHVIHLAWVFLCVLFVLF